MTSTYTPSLRVQEIGNGDQAGTWGTTTNTNWTLMEQAVAGVVSISMTNANYTLTSLNGVSDEARNMVVVATGTISNTYQIIAPLESKIYIVVNNTVGGFDITFGGSGGAVVTIPHNYAVIVYGDGTDFYPGNTASANDFRVLGDLYVDNGIAAIGNAVIGGNLTLAGNLSVTGGSTIVPVGTITLYPSSTPPTGFLICSGQAVSRGTYAALFALVGTTFGPGDTTTTFNLPNIPSPIPYIYYVIKY